MITTHSAAIQLKKSGWHFSRYSKGQKVTVNRKILKMPTAFEILRASEGELKLFCHREKYSPYWSANLNAKNTALRIKAETPLLAAILGWCVLHEMLKNRADRTTKHTDNKKNNNKKKTHEKVI